MEGSVFGWRRNAKGFLVALLAGTASVVLLAQPDGVASGVKDSLPLKGMWDFRGRLSLEGMMSSDRGVRFSSPVVRPLAPMPFFCRMEHRLEQRMPLPLKFRLGDVPYVDKLEGKRRWYE
ncbi:MAG: hypothetical protein RMJ33_03140 [Saprospiraceae bacterium]|nr:hypothetical protein [Saprospiraceae bacterium]